MIAVVLVGGRGTRLRPLTLTTPKQMLPVAGRPMIERVLAHLAAHGVDEVVLSLGYRPDAFRDAYPDGSCAGVRLHYAVEPEPLDTAGGIAFAARHAGVTETFVVQNGDVLTTLDVSGLIDFHRGHGGMATIALTPVEDPSRYGVVATDAEGRVTAFVEKPEPGHAPSNWINAGTYVLEPAVLESIAGDRPVSIEREIFPALVGAGNLFAQASVADWVDAGTAATYLGANLSLARREDHWVEPGACIDPGAVVTESIVSAGAAVAGGATVEGALLMAGARVGPGATVRHSIVGSGAVVGDGAVVEALSMVGDGATVAAGSALSGAVTA
ncbi:MAG TPA: NDP-sugar synthase [Acidimicrobiales bacterium]|nr:NDP-sugar synthase [Acidimicrobiales bacterium]